MHSLPLSVFQSISPSKILYKLLKSLQKKIPHKFSCVVKEKYLCKCKQYYGKYTDLSEPFSIPTSSLLKVPSTPLISARDPKDLISPKFHNMLTSIIVKNYEGLSICRFCNRQIFAKYKLVDEGDILVFALQWETPPGPYEILQSLLIFEEKVNFRNLVTGKLGGTYALKGLIGENYDKAMCITVNSKNRITRIEDNMWKEIIGGRWIDTIFNLSNNAVTPNLIWYEKSETRFIESINPSDLVALELKICQKAGFFDPWPCPYCLTVNSALILTCPKCHNAKNLKPQEWLSTCGHLNIADSTRCELCYEERYFLKGKIQTCLKCHKKSTENKCRACNSIKCINCMRDMIEGQRVFHETCGQSTVGFCNKCQELVRNGICFLCRDLFFQCYQCLKLHLKSKSCEGNKVHRCSLCFFCIADEDLNVCWSCEEVLIEDACKKCEIFRDPQDWPCRCCRKKLKKSRNY